MIEEQNLQREKELQHFEKTKKLKFKKFRLHEVEGMKKILRDREKNLKKHNLKIQKIKGMYKQKNLNVSSSDSSMVEISVRN